MEWKEYSQSKVIHPDDLEKKVQSIKQHGTKIATLNGSFDLLHAGHLYILYEASKVADCLIVAVNSDSSVRSYKGKKRPLIPLSQRLEMLSALSFVDYLTWFDEPTPCILLEKIKPDVHVNGAEYGLNCIEADVVQKNGGRLYLVDRIPGLATSEIIKKIQESACD